MMLVIQVMTLLLLGAASVRAGILDGPRVGNGGPRAGVSLP